MDLYKTAVEKHNPTFVIGIDEVGWGALAGPLVLGCVVYKTDFQNPKIKDSKAYTTEKAREKAYELVQETAECVDVYALDASRISRIGAGNAIKEALNGISSRMLARYPDSGLLVLDGTRTVQGLKYPQVAIDKADAFVPAVSAASIVAKVYRDRFMSSVNSAYPEFEWHQNKGYPTQRHVKAIQIHGVSEYHRTNIGMIKDALSKYGSYEERHNGVCL